MEGSHDCPFSDGAGMVRFIRGTVRRRRDLMIACEGAEGTGKSTTAGNLAKAILPSFDMSRDVVKDIDHLLQIMHDHVPGQIHVLDEAVNIFHNQDWATWEAKGLSKLIRQMRTMRCAWICNIPDFEGLHPYIRNNRIQIRIYHRPVYDEDGMVNGPSQVFWKDRRFGFKEQAETMRWWQVIDELHVESLDALPEWTVYEDNKIANFKSIAKELMERRHLESFKERKALAKAAEPAPAVLAAPAAPTALLPNQAFYDQVLDDLRRAP